MCSPRYQPNINVNNFIFDIYIFNWLIDNAPARGLFWSPVRGRYVPTEAVAPVYNIRML